MTRSWRGKGREFVVPAAFDSFVEALRLPVRIATVESKSDFGNKTLKLSSQCSVRAGPAPPSRCARPRRAVLRPRRVSSGCVGSGQAASGHVAPRPGQAASGRAAGSLRVGSGRRRVGSRQARSELGGAGPRQVWLGPVGSRLVTSGRAASGQGRVSAARARSGRARPGHVGPGHVGPGRVRSARVWSGQGTSGQVCSGGIGVGRVMAGQVGSGQLNRAFPVAAPDRPGLRWARRRRPRFGR